MTFDKSPQTPKQEKKSNMTNPPTSPLIPNNAIPKNNVGTPPRDNQPRPRTPEAYPDDGTFSPIPQYFSYTANLPSHYQPLQFDWGEPSFGLNSDSFEDNPPQNVDAEQNNPLLQDVDPANDDIFNELYSNSYIFGDEESEERPASPYQEAAQTPAPAPKPVPTQQNTDNNYQYNSLEEVLDFWLNTLGVNKNTRIIYRSRLIHFITQLDSEGIHKISPAIIDNYCSQKFNDNQYGTLIHFKSVLKRFIKWISANHAYDKIRPYQQQEVAPIEQPSGVKRRKPKIDPSTQFINKALSDAFNEWSKTLKGDVSTNAIYKTQILNFMMFLLQIKKLDPTPSDIQKYFQSRLENQTLNDLDTCKIAIKSFLQFLEKMAIHQDHEVYKFLDSINSNKTK